MLDVIIIDEAVHDTRTGIAVALGALRGFFKLLIWAGDHYQGEGIVTGSRDQRRLPRPISKCLCLTCRVGQPRCEPL